MTSNVSLELERQALATPGRTAIVGPDGTTTGFGELEQRCRRIAGGLRALGLEAGDRVCLFVPPSAELIAVTHALFRLGAVPVLIDPGMGRRNLLACVEHMQPRGLIGVAKAQLARTLFPRAFGSVVHTVTVGRRLGWSGPTLAELEARREELTLFHAAKPAETAAILFTSGSTGAPKGVVYTHAIFGAQLAALRRLYDLRPGETDAACFPLFALFDNALGMTSVFPRLDPSRPAQCDPAAVCAAIERHGATFAFGSPAIWRRVLPWLRANGRRFTRLTRVTIAGAPVPPRLVLELRERLAPGGDVHTPYGATEALPVTNLGGAELTPALTERSEHGEGTCVGRPVPGVDVRRIRITDEPIEAWTSDLEVAPDEPGEICVRGPIVTPSYAFDAPATALAKIRHGAGAWHRMGDVGLFDGDGRLWFHGRKSHRLDTERGLLMPVPLENVFNSCAGVRRTALVGVGARGAERPCLIVEAERGESQPALAARLREHGACHGSTDMAGVLFRRDFPVDVRHNAKIHRDELKTWAQRELARGRAR